MRARSFVVGLAVVAAVSASLLFSGIAMPASAGQGGIATRSYDQTNLVSDIPGLAAHTDPNLENPWGTSVGPGSPIWVSDNHVGVTTLYDGAGNPQPNPNRAWSRFQHRPPPAAARSGRRPGRRSTPSTRPRPTS
jgi:hypothetical protein